MFASSAVSFFNPKGANKSYSFPIKRQDSIGVISRVKEASQIDQNFSRSVLVESFIGEYQKYLQPDEIGDGLTSWREGDKSVSKYYEDYFKSEFEEFNHGKLDYWVQATVEGKVVGWATFVREKLDKNAVYMNLLVVHPDYQGKGIGEQLVNSLVKLQEIPDLSAIHLLLRKKNLGGRIFYSKLGFLADPEYKRDDNFVSMDLLQPFTRRKPALEQKATAYPGGSNSSPSLLGDASLFKIIDPLVKVQLEKHNNYCGFALGFLKDKRF